MRACLLLMLAALYACASETPDEPAAGAQAQGGKRFELLAPNGEIDRPPSEMRWRVGPGLKSCRVMIITETAEPIWTSAPTDEGVAQLPEEAQVFFKPGVPYHWKVVCSFSGLQLGSEYASFTLVEP